MNKPARLMLASAVVLASGGCSVLEDREPCPCYLDIDYREVLSSDLSQEAQRKIEAGLFDLELCWTTHHSLPECPLTRYRKSPSS